MNFYPEDLGKSEKPENQETPSQITSEKTTIERNLEQQSQNVNSLIQFPLNESQIIAEAENSSTNDQHIPVDIPTQLFIFNQSNNTTEEQLKQLFAQSGTVLSVILPQSKGLNRGFGIVTLKNKVEAENAKELFDYSSLNGEQCLLSIIQNNSFLISPTDVNLSSLIDNIFTSNSQNEEQKIKQLNEIYLKYKNENEYKLILLFDQETYTIIESRLNDLSTESEIVLLNIIEIITERINEIPSSFDYLQYWKSCFISEMEKSRLISKIENIIRQRVAQEKEQKINIIDNAYPILTEKLIIIYLQVKKSQLINNDFLNTLSNIISLHIDQLIQVIKNGKELTQGNKKEDIDENQEMNKRIKSMTKIIKSIDDSDFNNKFHFFEKLKLHENIALFLHFNCPTEIICPLNIYNNMNQNLKELQIASLTLLQNITYINEVQNYLINTHPIIPHLIISSISFASSCSTYQHQIKVQQQSVSMQSINFVGQQLHLLYNLLKTEIPDFLEIILYPNLIQSLIKLNQYRIVEYISEEMDKVAFQIRNKCIQLFERIYEEGNQNALESLTKNGHANSLVIKVGADDGYYGIDGEELDSNLFDLRCFFRTLHKGRQFNPQYQVYPSYPPQICLAQQSKEQLEEEGSLEEIDAYLANQLNNEKIKKSANQAKNSIFNIFHDDANTYDGKDEDLYEDAHEEGEESSEEFGDDGDE